MSVTSSFAVGILLPLCNNVIHGANNNFESGVPVGSFLNLPIRIFTNPRKPTELFYQTIIPSPNYPNSIFRGSAVPQVTNLNQHMPRPIAGKTRRISKTELEIANKYRLFPTIIFPIQIYGKDFPAFIDTGSPVSIMFKDVAEKIFQSSLQLFQVKGNGMRGADGKNMADYGFIFTNASTPFGSILLRLAIVEGFHGVIVLGRNFLFHPAVKAKLDFGNSKLTIAEFNFYYIVYDGLESDESSDNGIADDILLVDICINLDGHTIFIANDHFPAENIDAGEYTWSKEMPNKCFSKCQTNVFSIAKSIQVVILVSFDGRILVANLSRAYETFM